MPPGRRSSRTIFLAGFKTGDSSLFLLLVGSLDDFQAFPSSELRNFKHSFLCSHPFLALFPSESLFLQTLHHCSLSFSIFSQFSIQFAQLLHLVGRPFSLFFKLLVLNVLSNLAITSGLHSPSLHFRSPASNSSLLSQHS